MYRQQEPDAHNIICSQLTLRVVVWDLRLADAGETAKIEREWDSYQVRKIDLFSEIGILEKPADSRTKYDMIRNCLAKIGMKETDALLVTDDAVLAAYVYGPHKPGQILDQPKQGRPGMAVVFYERETDGRCVEADLVVQGFEEIGVQFLDRVHKRKNGLPWNILYTKRTCVREITLDDLDALFELYRAKGMTDYTEPLFERDREEAYTRDYIKWMYYYYGYGMWVVCDRNTGRLIGRAGIEQRDTKDGGMQAELGYVIARDCQNQGYAQEVGTAVLEYAAQELEMEEMHCMVHRANAPSVRVAEKLGFVLCETEEQKGDMLHYYKLLSSGKA